MSDTIAVGDLMKQLASLGTDKSPRPVTIASAATVAPTTYLSVITGTTAITTITIPYAGFQGTLAFVWTDAGTLTSCIGTGGNIAVASTPVRYKVMFLTYNPIAVKWYPSY